MYIFREREKSLPFIVLGQSTVDRTHGHTDTEMSAERELCVSHEESTALLALAPCRC
jgi:hypothetical protein